MKRHQRQRKADRRLFKDRISSVILGVMVVGMLAVLVVLVYQRSTTPLGNRDYEGKIVDRWADFSNSQYNPQTYFRLVVELSDGKRITVNVDSTVYESARVGMRIKSKSGQIVLVEPGASPNN